uniref:(northern house mosquito) hypothetical protein n=1 Tax=Culex pipiens TaxID=7175 RepID=A0A8D8GDD2_CULPI
MELLELYHRGAEGSGQESSACHRHFLHPRHRGVRVHQRVLLHDAVAGGGARVGGRGRDLRGSGVWHVRVDHSGFRGPVDLRRRQRHPADVIAPVLRRRLRGPNAGDSHHDPDPAAHPDAGRPHHGAAVDAVPHLVGHLCADQLRRIRHLAEYRRGRPVSALAAVEAAEPAPPDQGEHLLPDILPAGHDLRRGCPDGRQPQGDRLRVPHDPVQYSRLLHLHRVEKQTKVVQPHHGRIHSKLTKVDDGGAAKAEVNPPNLLRSLKGAKARGGPKVEKWASPDSCRRCFWSSARPNQLRFREKKSNSRV